MSVVTVNRAIESTKTACYVNEMSARVFNSFLNCLLVFPRMFARILPSSASTSTSTLAEVSFNLDFSTPHHPHPHTKANVSIRVGKFF